MLTFARPPTPRVNDVLTQGPTSARMDRRLPPEGSALRVTAGAALHAALFVDELLAALRALRVQAFPYHRLDVARFLLELDVGLDRLDGPAEVVERLDGRLDAGLVGSDVPLDCLRDRIGNRVDAFAVVQGDPRASDALELVDDLVDRDAGAKAQGHEAREALRERGGVSAAPADLREHFEQAFVVLVDGHVEGAVAREDLLRAPRDDVGAGAGSRDRRLRRHLDADLLRRRRGRLRRSGLRDADIEDLVLARTVPVHRDALALQLVREEVRLLHVVHGRVVGHVDRLRHSRITVVLEGRLHPHVPLRRDVVGDREDALPLLRHILDAARRAAVLED